jgi:hypothetical protein
MESIQESSTRRPSAGKARKLAVGVLAAAALSLSAATVATVTGSAVAAAPHSSHRLAWGDWTSPDSSGLAVAPDSVRLT